MRLFARILHHVDAKLYDIAAAHLEGFRWLACLTETLIVDEGAIAAARVLQNMRRFSSCTERVWKRRQNTHFEEELSLVVPQLSVIPW